MLIDYGRININVYGWRGIRIHSLSVYSYYGYARLNYETVRVV